MTLTYKLQFNIVKREREIYDNALVCIQMLTKTSL